MTDTRDRLLTAARLVNKLGKHPLVPDEARVCMEMLVLILGDLDDRLTEIERSNHGDRGSAG